MLEKNFEKLSKAYEEYNLEKREDISIKILNYIENRLIQNKENLEKISEIFQDVSYERIIEVYLEEVSKPEIYKKQKTLKELENGFVFGTYTTSVGNVAVETSSTVQVLRYFIYAIQSRNTITISDIDYIENDLKHAILLIFSEAIEKYGVSKNLINILPYEECYYDNFDLIIDLDKEEYKRKKEISKLYIYSTSNKFDEEIKKEIKYLESYNREYEIISGDFYKAILEINKNISSGAAIYTDNAEEGYKFINLVHSKNVFVNTSFAELDESIKEHNNPIYMNKKIMYPR